MEIRLNTEIFNEKSILAAIEAYKDLAQIEVKPSDKYFVLAFNNTKYDEVRTIKEFENYLVELENS